jgi:hypothetical protein
MTRDRDIGAFDARAGGYESGWLGRLHQQIADRTADLALTLAPTLTGNRSHQARTKSRAARLLATAGFRAIQWHHIEAIIIRAVTART